MPLRKTSQRHLLAVVAPTSPQNSTTKHRKQQARQSIAAASQLKKIERHVAKFLKRPDWDDERLCRIIKYFSARSSGPREAADMLCTCLNNITTQTSRKSSNNNRTTTTDSAINNMMLWRVWSIAARLYVLAGDVANKAYPLYQRIVQSCPAGVTSQLWFDIACMFYTAGNLSQAKTILVNILATDPSYADTPLAKFQLGRILRAQNKMALSLVCFESILDTPPRPLCKSDILFEIGLVHESCHEYDKAVKAYSEVVSNPLSAKALTRIAWLFSQHASVFQNAQQRHMRRHRRSGSENNDQQQQQQPLPSTAKTAKEIFDHMMVNEQMAFEAGLRMFHASLKIEGNDATTHLLLARALAINNKTETAFTVISNAIAQFPQCSGVWNAMAILYHEAMQYNDAYMALERAIQIQRTDYPIPEVLFNMGVVLATLERSEDANAKFREANAMSSHPSIKLQYMKIVRDAKCHSCNSTTTHHHHHIHLDRPNSTACEASHNSYVKCTHHHQTHDLLPQLLHLEETTATHSAVTHVGSRDVYAHARDLPFPPLGVPVGVVDLQKMMGEESNQRTTMHQQL
eukprot:c12676_g1_i1.p1 GENE.c12676_g1_i1~~c12676_g1_i1.p1  ORF type:complete len:574 (+),score=163.92 c12676_g1_i1:143-1864(+)